MSGFEGIVEYIKNTDDGIKKAKAKALIEVALIAEAKAKRNSTRQFIGRNHRTLTGRLLNAIYSKAEVTNDGGSVSVGVSGIPYGRIHEYGGTIKPRKAKKLWIPKYEHSGKLTPREFIVLMRARAREYSIHNDVAWQKAGNSWKPLFFLVDKVEMPERPYIRPAADEAFPMFGDLFSKHLGR